MQSAAALCRALPSRAHAELMAELIEQRFGCHPVMASTSNALLLSERASHGGTKRLKIKLGETATLLTWTLQSKASKK